jgi:hypothetical protein
MERIARARARVRSSPPLSPIPRGRGLLTIHHPSYVDLSRNAGPFPVYSRIPSGIAHLEASPTE